ncbi:hypothetical protein GCM10010278_73000 [Streptomyces melanogenes]|nr:hypothetical protein GCM10010278_73000 [Streptomyces melanogenes]
MADRGRDTQSAADRVIEHLGSRVALAPRRRFAKDAVLIVDGTLVPTRDHQVAEQSKSYCCSTNHQVVIDADTRLVVESGAKRVVGNTATIADGGYLGTGLIMPHHRRKGEELPGWKEAHNKSHRRVRACVEHAFARMKTWKILRDRSLRGDGVRHAMHDVPRLHNLALTG